MTPYSESARAPSHHGPGYPCLAPEACIVRLLAGSRAAVMGDLSRELGSGCGHPNISHLIPLFWSLISQLGQEGQQSTIFF